MYAVIKTGGKQYRLLAPGLLLVALGCGAPASSFHVSSSITQQPTCTGSALVVEDAPTVCRVPLHDLPASPYDDSLMLALMSPATAKSGAKTEFVLEITNRSDRMVPIGFDDTCGAFEANASNEHVTTFESECSAICGALTTDRFARFLLQPHGAVRKTVTLDAMRRAIRGDSCTAENLGPLPPGNYTLEVKLPALWFPPDADDRNERFFRAPIVVTP